MHKHELLAVTNQRLRRQATFASLAVASLLIAAKLVAWLMTDSVAMLTSLFDSTFDLAASLVTAYGVASALRPPDREHRYGHGKAEPLAVLAQAIFIIGSSVVLVYEAASRLYHPHPIHNDGVAYSVMGVAIVLTIALIVFQHYVVSQTRSVAIGADKLHYVGDLAVNLSVIGAFLLHRLTGIEWFDPVFAVAIASGLLVSAFHILKHALVSLMDAELPPQQRAQIRATVLSVQGVRGVHDLRTRSDGDRIFIVLHVEMDGQMTLLEAHSLSEKIMDSLMAQFPHADVTIHQDPVGIIEDRLDTQIEARQREAQSP